MELDPKPDQIFDVDESNFEELVIKESENRVVVVDFWAPWCGPCKQLGPALERLSPKLAALCAWSR